MQNAINNAASNAAATVSGRKPRRSRKSVDAALAPAASVDIGGGVAVLEAPPKGWTEVETSTEPTTPAESTPTPPAPPAPADPITGLAALVSGPIEHTRQELLDARTFTLMMKQSAKRGGFGEKVGPMLRNTLGYKFDSMDIMDMLREMAKPDFLDRYKAATEKWYGGLNKSATEGTLKTNAAKYEAAMAMFSDRTAYAKLVRSLLILCQRNQSWMESGSNVALPYNGHKAVLDLFGVNVTNSRRLKLTAN